MNPSQYIAAVSVILSIVFNTTSAADYCFWSMRTVTFVNMCPQNEESTRLRMIIKKCEGLAYKQNCTNPSKFKYHCLPSQIPETLVEVCTTEMDIYGACVEYNTDQGKILTLGDVKCSILIPSCPDIYLSTQAHLIAPCYQNIKWFNQTSMDRNTSSVSNHSKGTGVVYGFLAVGLTVFGILIIFFSWKHLSKKTHNFRMDTEMLQRENDVSTRVVDLMEMERMIPQIEKDPSGVIGKHRLWKSSISDEFSRLGEDELCLLFCFMCSDTSPPDFKDTEWLDILNETRRIANPKYDPKYFRITSDKAHQTLERLKLSGFLKPDQMNQYLTKDAQDMIIYHLLKYNDRGIYHLFYLSSFNTARRYLRSHKYNRKYGEKCVTGVRTTGALCDSVLIQRLQMNILTHDTMEDTEIFDKVAEVLAIPIEIVKGIENDRKIFLEELKQKGEAIYYRERSEDSVDQVTWLWRHRRPDIVRSCIGLHPHWDIYIVDNKAYRKPSDYHQYSPAVRCHLYGILLVDQYAYDVNNDSHRTVFNKLKEKYFTDPLEIDFSIIPKGLNTIEQNGTISFASKNQRDDIMYAFVTECLVEESELEFFLNTGSKNVIFEYCRIWTHKRNKEEKCLYIPCKPEQLQNLFIDKLQLDIIVHSAIVDKNFQKKVINHLKITEEVINWDEDAKRRFISISKHGSVNICRARGMLVGCAGAGKTTLLRKLKRKEALNSHGSTETTIGLEIHEDLFEIKDDTLIDYMDKKTCEGGILSTENTQIISMTDFAGQVAYYACHQIYLSRRAFYLVVMDMSKRLDEMVHNYDTDRHNPKGSLFQGWTYKDYFLFWLRSIKTYCDDEMEEEEGKKRTKANPVILIGTHHDCIEQENNRDNTDNAEFYDELERCLPKEHTLKSLISPKNYHEIECPQNGLNEKQRKMIEEVRKCIVYNARSLAHWGEKIPIKWALFDQYVREKREERILSREELRNKKEFVSLKELEISDMLRYFQEIGLILYFTEKGLKDNIIIDVQWFVDAFKNIITDPTHAQPFCKRVKEWEVFINTGRISNSTLMNIWRENDASYFREKHIIIPYMEKLGILATLKKEEVTDTTIDRPLARSDKDKPVLPTVQTNVDNLEMVDLSQDKSKSERLYYVPSINKTDFSEECRKILNNVNKTPILVFYFKTYIPHFFFFRLVAKCFSEWVPLSDDLFCKNVAFYKDKGGDRNIAVAVNKTSIQLQVFTPDDTIPLTSEKTREIRSRIEEMIRDITTTYHHRVFYDVGYQCKNIDITDEDENWFVSEKTIAELETNIRICPNFVPPSKHEKHKIVRDDLLQYWYGGRN